MEIILSISLVAILFTVTVWILDRGITSFATISERGTQTQEARFSMERMVREIIRIKAGPSGDLQNLQTSQISFKDSLGLNTDFHLNSQDQTLYRGSDPLLKRVTALTFTGYKSDNAITQSTPQTRRIRIALTTLPEGETTPLTFRTDVFLRTDMYENFK